MRADERVGGKCRVEAVAQLIVLPTHLANVVEAALQRVQLHMLYGKQDNAGQQRKIKDKIGHITLQSMMVFF